MSASQHIEWLNLVEKTGPFLAVGVLDDAFPQGLEKVETRRRQRVRSAYDEWRDAVDEGDPQLGELHREWIRLILVELLEYEPSVLKPVGELPGTLTYREPLSGVEVKPDFAVLSGDKARLLVATYAPDTDFSAPIKGETWAASPAERMIALCRSTGVRVGLLTDGEQWTLVSVPSDGGSSVGTWYARIWQQEPVTLQAFVSLLEVRRCFGPEEGTLDSLFLLSLEHQDEVTDTLGEQVRRAVEVLVQALDRADLDRDRQLLKDITSAQLYEAGLTVMMRLVVLLCAEERRLLLLGEPIYDQYYAVSTLRARLREDKERLGDEVLERRHDAWSRLLAVFRAVFGGIEHETLRLPALGGSLFDPDRFPFLEGRATTTSWRETPAIPLPIDNRTVFMLLTALQVLEQKSGALQLSYEALDVEQIGHVYEGLLERTVKRVPETTLGLIGSQKKVNPNVALRELEELREKGSDTLVVFLNEHTGRSESGLRNALAKPVDEALHHHILLACGSDAELADRIAPFAHLLRTDSWGDPLVYLEQAFIITMGAGRRETGTHYTPKSLTEPIVQHTMEPLIYAGPAEGQPLEEWRLKSSAELLALKVCDMAMGSGAFLVQTCRWLGERLVEAWDAEEKAGRAISIEGVVLDRPGDFELLPRDQAERVLIARRLVASRCLYGVDINPMAVELAKVSLWLVTMMRNRPFSFLDHAFKCGDSLLGIIQLKQLEHFSLRDRDHAQPLLELRDLPRQIEGAASFRLQLEVMPNHTASQITEKARLHGEAETQLAKLRGAADFLVAAELDCPSDVGWDTRRAVAASRMQNAWKEDIVDFQRLAHLECNGRRPFHWPIEFPEIFAVGTNGERHAGFDAFVGNPPFMGGQKITGRLGTEYRNYLVSQIAAGRRGSADLCAYFVLRASTVLNLRGSLAMVATKTISEGDTREVCLDYLSAQGFRILRAITRYDWPGEAAVLVSVIWLTTRWEGRRYLDGQEVSEINTSLGSDNSSISDRLALKRNKALCGIGSYLQGTGFYLEPNEAISLLKANRSLSDVIKPLIRGEDVTNVHHNSPVLFAINFGERDEESARAYKEAFSIAEQRVKPERMAGGDAKLSKFWWRYKRTTTELYDRARELREVLVHGFTSKFVAFRFVSSDSIFAAPLVVVLSEERSIFAVLQSSLHQLWVANVSNMGTTLRYTPSDCFETFPFPEKQDGLVDIGELYYETRGRLMLQREEGLTQLYNNFHKSIEGSADIARLRGLHRHLDIAVAFAYGWNDLAANEGAALGHDFHETKQGIRFTLSPTARREVLDRLLALNHQRHAEEITTGLHRKGAKKGKKPKRAGSTIEETLF